MIVLNTDDIVVQCMNVPDNQIPTVLVKWLEDFEPYEYMDTSDLIEHMYNPETVREVLDRHNNLTEEFEKVLSEIEELMVEYKCAYFRIVKI